MLRLRIRLFGEYSAVDYHGNALSVGDVRTQALVIYLALLIDGKPSLQEIGQLLFGRSDAYGDVRDVIRKLNAAVRFLPHDILIDEGATIRFNRDTVEVDTHRFNELIGIPSVRSTRRATELYRGHLLEDYSTGITAFDRWLDAQRQALWRAALVAYTSFLTAQIRAGWWEDADETARRLLLLDPSLRLEPGRLRKSPAPTKRADSPVLILVLEDDLVSSALLQGFLDEAGYEVVSVTDGADVLLELGRREFDLLILDINVPTLNGLKVFEIMLQKNIDTPALFISGVAGTEVETQTLEMGAAGFLRKPIRKDVLLQRVRAILERSRRRGIA